MKKENEEKYRKLNYFRKIRRGSNYNAYQRQNLGSIPSKIDNFIFKLPDESTKNLTATLSPTILMMKIYVVEMIYLNKNINHGKILVVEIQ